MRKGVWALAGTAAAAGAGVLAQRTAIARRRRNDPEAGERYGTRRAERSRMLELADGARLFVEETGPEDRREGVVFVHGSCLRTDVWHHQIDGIGDHRLIFYDLRGHGLSQPKGNADYSVQTLATDLKTVIEDAGLEEVVIVGHSVGGMAALQLCCLYPEMARRSVKGLVLLNTTYRPAAETLLGGAAVAKLERLTRRPLDALGMRADYVDRLRKIIKPSSNVFMMVSLAAFGPGASARQIDFTYDMLADTPADVIFDLLRCYRDFDVTDLLNGIGVPTLVVAGSHDRLTVAKASEYIVEHMADSRLHVFEGCGHMSMLERYRELNILLEGFFDEELGATSPARGKRFRRKAGSPARSPATATEGRQA